MSDYRQFDRLTEAAELTVASLLDLHRRLTQLESQTGDGRATTGEQHSADPAAAFSLTGGHGGDGPATGVDSKSAQPGSTPGSPASPCGACDVIDTCHQCRWVPAALCPHTGGARTLASNSAPGSPTTSALCECGHGESEHELDGGYLYCQHVCTCDTFRAAYSHEPAPGAKASGALSPADVEVVQHEARRDERRAVLGRVREKVEALTVLRCARDEAVAALREVIGVIDEIEKEQG